MDLTISSSCNGCSSDDRIGSRCPVCKNQGREVPIITVESLVHNFKNEAIGNFMVCMNHKCDVVYYNTKANILYKKDLVKVPVWFKDGAEPKYACYCSNVTEEQIIEAVVAKGAKTVKDVNKLTGAMKEANCKVKNPLGICCHQTIQGIIERFKEHEEYS